MFQRRCGAMPARLAGIRLCPLVFGSEAGDGSGFGVGLPCVVGGHVGGSPAPGLLHGDQRGSPVCHGDGASDPEGVAGGAFDPGFGGALPDRVRDGARAHCADRLLEAAPAVHGGEEGRPVAGPGGGGPCGDPAHGGGPEVAGPAASRLRAEHGGGPGPIPGLLEVAHPEGGDLGDPRAEIRGGGHEGGVPEPRQPVMRGAAADPVGIGPANRAGLAPSPAAAANQRRAERSPATVATLAPAANRASA